MKKILIIAITMLSVFTMQVAKAVELPEKTDHEIVKVYLFWSNSCHNCHDLMTYFSTRYAEYSDYFEIVTYRVDDNSTNSKLSSNIAEQVGEEPGYIPLVIIGDSYHVLGWKDSLGETIIEEALKAYEDEKYTDIVAKEIKKSGLNVTEKTFEEALDIAEIDYINTTSSDEKNNNAIIIGVVFGIVIAGFVGLIIISRKN